MVKKLKNLICPKCGAHEPVFYINIKLKAWPVDDWEESYDFELDDDYAYMEDKLLDAIEHGEAICECSVCGTKIEYYIEDDKNEAKHI